MNEETQVASPAVEENSPAPVENAEVQPTTGSEAVTNTEETKQYVPFERFQEVNNKLKDLSEKFDSLNQPAQPQEPAQEIDPDTSKLLESWAKQQGLVSRSELEADRKQEQAAQDLKNLQAEFKLSDEDLLKVRDEAVKAGAANYQGLKNAYFARQYSNLDRIVEDRVKEALAKGETFAERSGSGGAQKPDTKPELDPNLRGQDRLKARIQAARSKLS